MRIRTSLLVLLMMTGALAVSQAQQQVAPHAATPENVEKARQEAQNKPPQSAPTVSSVLDKSLEGVEKEFVSAAEAMPAEKYNFAPTNGEFKGVRTFAQQVKHVAAVNHLIFSLMLGEAPPKDGDENGPASIKTKDDIVQYLKDSFALGHRALAAMDESNYVAPIPSPFGGGSTTTRLRLAVLIVGHCFDHYGQMVEYLRMNGIVPPASRQ
jgi:uncharacterized damage-inducible protein DinB